MSRGSHWQPTHGSGSIQAAALSGCQVYNSPPFLGQAFTCWQFPISNPKGALPRSGNTPCTTFFNMTSNLLCCLCT